MGRLIVIWKEHESCSTMQGYTVARERPQRWCRCDSQPTRTLTATPRLPDPE